MRQTNIWAKPRLHNSPRSAAPVPYILPAYPSHFLSPVADHHPDLKASDPVPDSPQRSGIPELAKTTRDEPDYDKLMRGRIEILPGAARPARHPEGNRRHARCGRARARPLRRMPGGDPVGHLLPVRRAADASARLPDAVLPRAVVVPGGACDYRLRMQDQKRASVKAFRELTSTPSPSATPQRHRHAGRGRRGNLARPPANVAAEFPQFPVTRDYDGLRRRSQAQAAPEGRILLIPPPKLRIFA